MKNFSIRIQLILMLLVPITVLAVYSISAITEKRATSSEMAKLKILSELAEKISNLIHETQKERGMTAGFIGSRGAQFKDELPRQRELTDKKRAEMDEFLKDFDHSLYGSELKKILDTALTLLSDINNKRSAIDGFTIPLGEAIGYYTKNNAAFLEIIGFMGQLSKDGEVGIRYLAYYFLQNEKERAGIERAVLSAAFAADKFAPGMYRKTVELISAQDNFRKLFLSSVPQADVDMYFKIMSGEAIAETDRMKAIALEKADEGGFGIDAAYWFKMQTEKINKMREVVEYVTGKMLSLTLERKKEADYSLALYVIATLAAFAVTILFATVILRSIIGSIAVVVNGMKILAEKNLTAVLNESRNDEIGQLSRWFNSSTKSLREVMSMVAEATSRVSSAAEELSASARQSTHGTEDQTQRTDAIASAMEELSATISSVSSNLNDAAEISKQAMETALEGGKVATNAIKGMNSIDATVKESAKIIETLGERSQQIGEVINVINDIADQTNLLALNAAIEAARAGEHGRGFAVVADEVRKLAERTTKATKEIGVTIEDIQIKTGEAVTSMNRGTGEVSKGLEQIDKTGEALQQIVNMVKKLADRVSEVAVAAEEQAATTTEITNNTVNVSRVAKEMANGAEQTSAAALDLTKLAGDLTSMVKQFKI
ncbi:MAG: methyl-accepting chemotaxis protein [Nitrospinota bacterium]|nr:methyl-accepting chemotaxis protein [Nitrospinota bacterium]